MKRNLRSLLLLPFLAAAAMLASCSSSDEDVETPPPGGEETPPTLTIQSPDDGDNPTKVEIGQGRYSKSYDIVTTGSWRIEKSESGDWLTISPASGKGNTSVAFTAEANESTSEKEAEVNFYLEEELVHTMTVIQAGSTPYLTVSPTQVATLPVEGGDVELTVETNTSGWEYAITGSSSWLTEKSREENKLVLTAPVNEGAAKLEATVTISSKDDPTLKQEIAVAQYSLTADLLDVEFHNDGTATDLSPMHNQVEYVPGSALMTYHSESYDRYIAHFNQTPGINMSSSYYKVDYSANSAFQNALSDGHTLEALVMFDAESDGSKEIKPFSSMQSGGTGFLITTTAQGNCLTFLPHVGGSYRWAKSNITPVRGRYYHLVGVYDKEAQKARIYVDGELKNEVDATGNLTLAGSGARWFCIGGDAASSYGEASWKGDIVLARIYDAPLSDGSVAMLWDKVKDRQPQGGTIQISDLFFLSTANVQAGSVYKVFGSGFQSGDVVRLESTSDENRTYTCDCTVGSGSISITIPGGFVSGTYRMVLQRGEVLYPLGLVELTLSDNPTSFENLPEVVAHRGYHTTNGAAENSMESFRAAIELGVYGSEADFYITTDGVVVSNHDPTIKNSAGQTLTIANSTYDQIKDIVLSNGEKVATFDDYLDILATSSKTKLVIEIKDQGDATKNERIVDAIVEELQNRQMVGKIDLISFNYTVCQRFAKALPSVTVGYLSGDKAPSTIDPAIKCIDYSYGTLRSNPAWIQQAHDLGMKVNVWTVNSTTDMLDFIAQGVDYITTDYPVTLKEMLEKLSE